MIGATHKPDNRLARKNFLDDQPALAVFDAHDIRRRFQYAVCGCPFQDSGIFYVGPRDRIEYPFLGEPGIDADNTVPDQKHIVAVQVHEFAFDRTDLAAGPPVIVIRSVIGIRQIGRCVSEFVRLVFPRIDVPSFEVQPPIQVLAPLLYAANRTSGGQGDALPAIGDIFVEEPVGRDFLIRSQDQ